MYYCIVDKRAQNLSLEDKIFHAILVQRVKTNVPFEEKIVKLKLFVKKEHGSFSRKGEIGGRKCERHHRGRDLLGPGGAWAMAVDLPVYPLGALGCSRICHSHFFFCW